MNAEARPLKIIPKCVATDTALLAHIRLARDRNLPEFAPAITKNNGECVLVGSGPSVAGQIDKIREFARRGATIIAIKGAHDWLIDAGIIPDVAVALDPLPKIVNCFKSKRRDVSYLLASQVHPAVFDHLSDCRVLVFHAMSLIGEEKILGKRMLVGGGTTTGLRALNLAYLMGFLNLHLFGYDSSCNDKGEKRVNGDTPGRVIEITVGNHEGARKFTTNPAMASQANEFQDAVNCLPGVKVTVYGDGLLQSIVAERIRINGNEDHLHFAIG